MKKRNVAVLTVAAAVLLAACGSRTGEKTSEELVAPEVSSEDLLVSSLEYLLQEDKEEGSAAEEPQPQPVLPEDSKEEEAQETQGETAVIYYGNGGSAVLERETVTVETMTPEELINALARHNIMSLDTKVLAFEKREGNGASTLYLDLSKAAGEYLQTMSAAAESVIIASVIDTFLENYDADAICLTVEGEPLVAQDGAYTAPFTRCTPEELLEILQPEDTADAAQEDTSADGTEADGQR